MVMSCEPLDARQALLVEDHLHLVRAHLRRHAPGGHPPKRDREADDLYQEGCLGLIQAARQYDPAGGIPFAAYALRRIHHAVSQALYERFSTVRIPMRAQIQNRRRSDHGAVETPVVLNLEEDPQTRASDPKTDPSGAETIATHIREKYVAAVQRAHRAARKKRGRRGDRGQLVDRLVENRLLVPDNDHKTPLRQIARETHSSYSRVAGCEKKLLKEVADALRNDPQYRRLANQARCSADGLDTRIDDGGGAEELSARFAEALAMMPPASWPALLWQAVALSGGDPQLLLTRSFARLSAADKKSLCEQVELSCVEGRS